MPTPTLEKTWQVVSTQLYQNGTNLIWSSQLLFAIKEALKAVSLSPWVVVRSCDSSTAPDATDQWAATTDLIWGTTTATARSWIVLQQDGINTGFQMLIDLVGATAGSSLDIWISHTAGFTGGSTTARPTATDEVESFPGETKLWGGGNIDKGGMCHVAVSTDGECTRIFNTCLYNSHMYAGTFWLIDKPKNPVAHWTNPWIMFLVSSNGLVAGCSKELISTTSLNGQANISGGARSMAIPIQTLGSSVVTSVYPIADEVSGEWPFLRMSLWCADAGYRGTKGELFDMWWGINEAYLSGRTYPADGTAPDFVHFEDVILGWDSSVPLKLA